MSNNTIKQVCGQIKRNYSDEDFNPFKAMTFVYENLLVNGAGNRILIIGHTERFRKSVFKAWCHVLVDKGVLSSNSKVPDLQFNQVETHTGEILQFEFLKDDPVHQPHFVDALRGAGALCIFSEYESPDFKNIIMDASNGIRVLDFSKNNVKKS